MTHSYNYIHFFSFYNNNNNKFHYLNQLITSLLYTGWAKKNGPL